MMVRIVYVIVVVILAGCKHPIEIIGQGDVLSASGDRDCLLEDFKTDKINCTDNTVTTAYQETYFAVPRVGWQFGGWGNYCAKGIPADQCDFNISKQVIDDLAWDEVPPLTAYFRKQVTAGHQALFMGHSFFDPFAVKLPDYAASAGFNDHTQDRFFSGGSGGAPMAFWNDTGSDNNTGIKQILDRGAMTLFGMTYYPSDDREDNLQGYKNWIEYAQRNNDNFAVFIGLPWPRSPAEFSATQYKEDWLEVESDEIHDFIDQLRAAYPTLVFHCIPYGMGPVELKKMFDRGWLPDIDNLIRSESGSYLFEDNIGHPSDIIERLGTLIWLKAIYGVDLNNFPYEHPYSVDLKALATTIVNRHDHYYDAT